MCIRYEVEACECLIYILRNVLSITLMCVNVYLIMYYVYSGITDKMLSVNVVCTYCAWLAVDILVTKTVCDILLIIMSAIQKKPLRNLVSS